MVSECLPSDALSQHLPSYLGFSYLGCGVSPHSCSSKAQLLLLTLDVEYLLTATAPDLGLGVSPLGCYCNVQLPLQSPLLGSTSPTLSVYADRFVLSFKNKSYFLATVKFVCLWSSFFCPAKNLVSHFTKANLSSHSRMSNSRWAITPSWLSGLLRSFFV